MKPVDFDYESPATLAAATALLAGHENAKVMAGGQTLGPMLNLRLAQPELIVDIRRIPELTRVAEEGDNLVLGACTTHAAIEDGRVPDSTRGMLQRVASRIAYRAVRTRGTMGGSLSHADPAADWVTCLTALDASVSITGPRGTRRSKLAAFMRGVMETDLAADEILDAISVPRLSSAARWGYHKICRKTGEFAEAIGAVVVDRDRCRIVAGRDLRAPGRRRSARRRRRVRQVAGHRHPVPPVGSRPHWRFLPDEAPHRCRSPRFAGGDPAMKLANVTLTLNGEPVSGRVAPRTHLADFVRKHEGLTGTHLGCEHGVCGACTVEIDGEIARSCITYAVACEGASVRTIEDFDTDPLMVELRRAFTEEHALQCGYCTPGMLIAARDLIRRKKMLSSGEIRKAMSGNLCRCTGYAGIVRAIERVMEARAQRHLKLFAGVEQRPSLR